MFFIERTFELSGAEGLGAKPKPELIGPVLTHLHDTLQDAVRMGFLHSSRARGRIPSALKAAAEVRYLGHTAIGQEGTQLHFEVPTFLSAAAELFDQQLLWSEGPQPEQTAFELLGEALWDVRMQRKDSTHYDRGILQRINGYRRILKQGITDIRLPDTNLEHRGSIDPVTIDAAGKLSAAIPPPRRVRIAGRLDLMAASRAALKLVVKDGIEITALWEGQPEIEDLREYFNRDVVLEGNGIFRASGALLRVDATAITLAGEQDEFFRQVPKAEPNNSDYHPLIVLRAGEPSAYNRIWGVIPGEEGDEEFAEAVEAFS